MNNIKYKAFKFFSQKYLIYKDILVISDLHFGKAEHFNLGGVSLPNHSEILDLEKIIEIVNLHKPKTLIFLGDLFHARVKIDLDKFHQFITKLTQLNKSDFVNLETILIKGNHDKYNESFYQKLGIKLLDNLEIDNMIFTHMPLDKIPENKINIAGHVHPGVTLFSKAKQKIKLPCFAVKENQIIMPSFGYLTGNTNKTLESFKIFYAIADDQIIKIEK